MTNPITREHYTTPATRAERTTMYDPTNQSSPDADWMDDPGPELTEHTQRAVLSSEGIDADNLSRQDDRLLRDIRSA